MLKFEERPFIIDLHLCNPLLEKNNKRFPVKPGILGQ